MGCIATGEAMIFRILSRVEKYVKQRFKLHESFLVRVPGLDPYSNAGLQANRVTWRHQVPHTGQDLHLPDSSGDKNWFWS